MARSSTVEPSLIRRRRRMEVAVLAGRGVGIAATAAHTLSWIGPRGEGAAAWLMPGALLATAVMIAAFSCSAAAFRHLDGPRYAAFRLAQATLDTLVITGAVVFFGVVQHTTTWPLLVVPILVAGFQSHLRGALLAWSFTSAAYAVGTWAMVGRIPADLATAALIHLIVGIAVGTQAAAFARQVRELDAAREALSHQASHDTLTGLANRSHLAELAAAHAGQALAVLLLDLDDFKRVNDTEGHAAGDELLRVVGRRLRGCIGAADIACRLGGDEFVILLIDADQDTAAAVTRRIRNALAEPIDVGGVRLFARASIGSAVRPEGDGADLEVLTARADAAMYLEKAATLRDSAVRPTPCRLPAPTPAVAATGGSPVPQPAHPLR